MGDVVEAGAHVEIVWVVLEPEDRAPALPPATRSTPYVVRARGILLADSAVGETAKIRTQAGRDLEGQLEVIRPADTHTFGRPPQALVNAINAIQGLKNQR